MVYPDEARRLVEICCAKAARCSLDFGETLYLLVKENPSGYRRQCLCDRLALQGNRWEKVMHLVIRSYETYLGVLYNMDIEKGNKDYEAQERIGNCEKALHYLGRAKPKLTNVINRSVCLALQGMDGQLPVTDITDELKEARSLYDIVKKIEIWDRGDSNSGRAAPNRQ